MGNIRITVTDPISWRSQGRSYILDEPVDIENLQGKFKCAERLGGKKRYGVVVDHVNNGTLIERKTFVNETNSAQWLLNHPGAFRFDTISFQLPYTLRALGLAGNCNMYAINSNNEVSGSFLQVKDSTKQTIKEFEFTGCGDGYGALPPQFTLGFAFGENRTVPAAITASRQNVYVVSRTISPRNCDETDYWVYDGTNTSHLSIGFQAEEHFTGISNRLPLSIAADLYQENEYVTLYSLLEILGPDVVIERSHAFSDRIDILSQHTFTLPDNINASKIVVWRGIVYMLTRALFSTRRDIYRFHISDDTIGDPWLTHIDDTIGDIAIMDTGCGVRFYYTLSHMLPTLDDPPRLQPVTSVYSVSVNKKDDAHRLDLFHYSPYTLKKPKPGGKVPEPAPVLLGITKSLEFYLFESEKSILTKYMSKNDCDC